MTSLIALVMSVVMMIALAATARRVLGVAVGWARALLVGLLVLLGGQVVLEALSGTWLETLAAGTAADRLLLVFLLGLAVAWTFTGCLFLLVAVELLVPSGSLPAPARLLTGWGARRRRAGRYAAILRIAARHGLARFLRLDRGAAPATGGDRARTARSLRRALEDGGVTFVKLGQTLATRADLLSPEFLSELSALHADVAAAPWSQIEPAIAASLACPLDEVFTSVEPEPLAAASVGQVHRARLRDGTPVVVKVQRPGARHQIAADLDILERLASRLVRTASWARTIGLDTLAAGFAASLREELDYRVELSNTHAVAASLRPDSPVAVPGTHDEWCSARLLVMEEVVGTPLTRARPILAAWPEDQRVDLASAILREVLHQLLVGGVFHADLHPGNLVLRDDGSVVLLDFGSVGRLDDVSRGSLAFLLSAVDAQDSLAATDALLDLLDRPNGLDERALEREIGTFLVRYRDGLSAAGGADGPFAELLELVLRHRFTIPPQVAAAFRALATLEGTLALVAPSLDLVDAAREQARGLFAESLTPQEVRRRIERQVTASLPALQRLPRRLDKIVGQVESGRLRAQVRVLADPDDRAFVTGLVHHTGLTLLAAAATLGAVLLIAGAPGPTVAPGVGLHALLGYVLLFFGVVLALRVLVATFFGSPLRRPTG